MMIKLMKASILALLLLLVGCNEVESTPEKTAERLVSAMFNYGGTSLYTLLHIENDERLVPNKDLKGKIHNIAVQRSEAAKDRGGIRDVVYSPVEYINSERTRASMTILVTFNDDSIQNMPIILVKVDGDWRIELKF